MPQENSIELILFFLLAMVIMVPIFKRFHMGAILGYLVAGILIGPQVLNIVNDPQYLLHFAEIGVVMLLFVIGLELNPDKLWRMQRQIFALGGSQLAISALFIGSISLMFFEEHSIAIIIGLSLALSSTAFAVHLMAEKGILASSMGRKGFAILLMQDMAVIPILFYVQSIKYIFPKFSDKLIVATVVVSPH